MCVCLWVCLFVSTCVSRAVSAINLLPPLIKKVEGVVLVNSSVYTTWVGMLCCLNRGLYHYPEEFLWLCSHLCSVFISQKSGLNHGTQIHSSPSAFSLRSSCFVHTFTFYVFLHVRPPQYHPLGLWEQVQCIQLLLTGKESFQLEWALKIASHIVPMALNSRPCCCVSALNTLLFLRPFGSFLCQ